MNSDLDLEESIFNSALLLETPEARAAYLDSSCAGKPELRRQVEELIAAGEAVGTFLAQPALAIPLIETPDITSKESVTPAGFEVLGSYVGRYRLLQLIGQGGCGRVFLAEQEQPVRRQVALKVIKLGMDTRAVVARFEAERQALALMDHPHVAKVLDAGATETGRPFFVMDFVRGIPITRYCDQHHLDLHQCLELFIKVCHAVQHAHQKGLIHRDIKPSNILVLSVDGIPTPKVIDFGIAKATESRLTEHTVHSELHQFIGTPAYMSPEQADIGVIDIDTRSDIYSLGVLLYELLVGSTPFNGKEMVASGIDSMRKTIREKEPIRPSARLTNMPSSRLASNSQLPSQLCMDLDWIVMMCLEKDRQRRYHTANDLAADLKRYLNHEPVLARPPNQLYRFLKMVHRNQTVFASVLIAVFIMVIGTVVSTWYAVRANNAEKVQSYLRIEAQKKEIESRKNYTNETTLRTIAEKTLEQLRRLVYISDMNVADHALREGNIGSAVILLKKHVPTDGQSDLRGLEWRYLYEKTRGDDRQTLEPHRDATACVEYSPDGKTLVTSSFDGTMRVWKRNPDGRIGSFFSITNHARSRKSFSFSSKSNFLAINKDNQLIILDSSTYKNIWDLGLIIFKSDYSSQTFSPDGQQLAIKINEGIGVWNMDNRNRTVIAGTNSSFGNNLEFCSSNKILAVANRNTVQIWNTSTFQKVAESQQTSSMITSLIALKNGDYIFVGRRDGTITLLSVPKLNVIKKWKAHSSLVYGLAISPDGKTIASGGGDQIINLWGVSELINSGAATESLKSLRGHCNQIWALAFSPDSRYLASGSKDGVINQWDLLVEGISKFSEVSEGSKQNLPQQINLELAVNPFPDDIYDSSNNITAHSREHGYGLDIIETRTGHIKWIFKNGSVKRLSSMNFSRSDKLIGIGGHDNIIRILETATGKLHSKMTGHFSAVSALIFSQDDQNIISGGTDGMIKIWDTETGREIISLDTKKGFVRDLKFDSKFNTLTAYFDRQNEGVFEIKFPNLSEIDSSVIMGFSDSDPQD